MGNHAGAEGLFLFPSFFDDIGEGSSIKELTATSFFVELLDTRTQTSAFLAAPDGRPSATDIKEQLFFAVSTGNAHTRFWENDAVIKIWRHLLYKGPV